MGASPRIPPLTEVQAEQSRRHLRRFARYAWAIVDPAHPLLDNWHLDALCDHLEAVTRRDILKLAINIGPGYAKSLLVSVIWPAWEWIVNPAEQSIFTSYAHALAVRDSVRCRQLIESPWYRDNFRVPGGWDLKDDSNQKHDFSNTKEGRRLSTSVDGHNTGERGDKIVADDPNNIKKIKSDAHLAEVITWWDKTMSSRLNSKKHGARVVIQQRGARKDLTGHLIASKAGYQILTLPTEYNPARKCVTFTKEGTKFWEDPRTLEGDMLFPALLSRDELPEIKRELGTAGYNAQHGQDPAAEGSSLFERKWWRFWKPDGGIAQSDAYPRPEGCWNGPARAIPPQALKNLTASVDAAFKETDTSDSVAIQVWGCHGADRFLIYRHTQQMDFTKTVQAILMVKGLYPAITKWLIEDKANGSAIITTLQHELAGIVPVQPEGGKVARAASQAPQVEAGNVYLPEHAPWLDHYITQHADFPEVDHDDDVDSTSQALLKLAGSPDVARARALAGLK